MALQAPATTNSGTIQPGDSILTADDNTPLPSDTVT